MVIIINIKKHFNKCLDVQFEVVSQQFLEFGILRGHHHQRHVLPFVFWKVSRCSMSETYLSSSSSLQTVKYSIHICLETVEMRLVFVHKSIHHFWMSSNLPDSVQTACRSFAIVVRLHHRMARCWTIAPFFHFVLEGLTYQCRSIPASFMPHFHCRSF